MCRAQMWVLVAMLAISNCSDSRPTNPTPPPPAAPAPTPTPQPAPPAPSFAGQWVGTYRMTGCTDSGQMATQADLCGQLNSIFGQGSRSLSDPLPVRFLLAQSGSTVTGRVELGSVIFTETSATIRPDQQVILVSQSTLDALILEGTWFLQTPSTGILTGTHRQVWRHGFFDGEAIVSAVIVDVRRITGG